MTTPTISFRISNEELKNELNKKIQNLIESIPEIQVKGQVLGFLIKAYESGYETVQNLPFDAELLLKQINCDYLQFEGDLKGFLCYEKFHRTKKPSPIGSDPDFVKSRCLKFCPLGKRDSIQAEVEKQLRRKNIKSLADLRRVLIQYATAETFAQFYICQADLFNGNIFISKDGLHLKCPEMNQEEVTVLNYCNNRLNPKTGRSPCQYLIFESIPVETMPPQEVQEIMQQLEYSEEEEAPKIVEATIEGKEE